jgi:hypothetical protein
MAKAGRPLGPEKVEWKVHIPVDLGAQVELLLKDPALEKVKYGARNQLIEKLLRQWIKDKVAGRTT